MFNVYVLESEKGRFYIGYTSKTVEERLFEHNHSKCRWTKNKGPWKVRCREEWNSKEEAYRREQQIKKYKGGRAFQSLINTHKNLLERSHSLA